MPYGRKMRDWRRNMTKQGISRKHKILILVLVCAIMGTVLFGLRVSAATVSGFNIGGLTATCDNSGDGYTTVNTTGNNSITVTTIAKESGIGLTYTYAQKDSTLTIKNGSGKALKITYSLTQGSTGNSGSTAGTFTPSGVEFGTNKQISIPADGTVSVYITSGSRSSVGRKISDKCATSYTITVTNVEEESKDINVTFATVTSLGGVLPGTYTVTTGGETKTVSDSAISYTKDINTQYTLKATANEGYSFEGWYVNNKLVSSENPYANASFAEDSNVVEARFYDPDPLMNTAKLNDAEAGETKYDYVKINSAYSHKDTGHSWHSETGASKDQYYQIYFPDSAWAVNGSAVSSSASGNATGDKWTSLGERSQAYAHIYSDVIQVQALKDCSISFKNTIGDSLSSSNFYYYVANSALNSNSNVANTVKTQGVENASGASVQMSLRKGQYLYIFSYGYKNSTSYFGDASLNYAFTSTISDFTITPNNTRYTVNVSFQDNVGSTLGAGSVKIGDTSYAIASSGSPANAYETVAGSEVTLAIAKAPTGYVHVGWQDVTANNTVYTTTYTTVLNESHEIKALFVPVMTITMGSDGYSNATYQYKNLAGNTVTANGQYVARRADFSKFYTTLEEAFTDSGAGSIVLLAGDTVNGNFTIPEGKNLVIPYSIDDTAPTDPVQVKVSSSLQGYYCTVTFNGNVTVDGGLMVNAKQAGANSGYPSGYIGRLTLGDSAKLTVNGTLYAYGYVVGGAIQVTSSGAVHEFVEITDMRVVTALGNIYNKADSMHVFPFSNFYIKNIETAVTYQSGAALYGHIAVLLAGSDEVTTTTISVIGKSASAMFNLTAGSMTKAYDRSTDKILFVINDDGTAATGVCTFNMSYKTPLGTTQNINLVTSDYYVPLCAGYGIQVDGNFTFNNLFKLLPGASLTVGKTGNLTVASGAELVLYRMNDYDARSSGKVANGEGYQGYTGSGFPKNARRFPSPPTSYPASRTAATTGSVKVHVDGVVNVLGGLFVTDNLVIDEAQNYSQTFENGYNNLTGSGTIIMNSAKQSSTSINEARQKSDTNDIDYATVNISALKALPYKAETDTPEDYSLTFDKTTYYGYVNPSGLSTWSTEKPVTITYDSGGATGTMDAVRVYPGQEITIADSLFDYGNYKFAGWNTAADGSGDSYKVGDKITLTSDITLYAMWSKVFTVTWKDHDGTILETDENVVEGSNPSYDGEEPTRAETEDIIYTFAGWDPELSPVAGDITYTAVYSELHKNVKLVHVDGTVDYYETVFAAVTAAADDETVVLLKDRTEPMIRIAEGKDLTLDLNGKNITSESGSAIENNGTISVIGSGTVSAASSGSAVLNNGTIKSISGGTFIGANVAGSGLLIAQGSTVGTISGGTFRGQYGITVVGTLDTINNASLTGTSIGLYVNGGTVNTISGGTFTGGSIGLSVSNTGKVNSISGGTFVSTAEGGYAVKSSSSTAITFVASGSPSSNDYSGPLFQSASASRGGTVSAYGDTKLFKYPEGKTVSCRANEKGYFYIGEIEIYTVTVKWDGTLSYTYQPNEYTWNPRDMRYEQTKTAGWSSVADAPTVTVSNGGSAADKTYGNITVGINYNSSTDYKDISMEFFIGSVNKGKNSARLVEAMEPGNSVKTTMRLSGDPKVSIPQGTTIGKVTLTLTTAD